MAPEPTLEASLARAFDVREIGAVVQEKMLSGRQRLAALVPQRGHLAKDGSLVVSHRAEITDGHPAGPTTVPLYLHFGAPVLPRESRRASTAIAIDGRLVPPLRRHLVRLDRHTHLTAFPLDPDLRQLTRLLRPGQALALFNRDLLLPEEPAAAILTLRLLGHRPGRRAVFAARAVTAEGAERHHLLKVYRPHAAERVWQQCAELRTLSGTASLSVAWPEARSERSATLRFPLLPGSTLHQLMETRVATETQVKAAGRLLRALHGARTGSEIEEVLQPFTLEDEISVLERWRRLLSAGSHPLHGQMAGLQSKLAGGAQEDSGPITLIHRDFYPKQLIVAPHTGKMTLIDVDTMSWGPAALDVGNFLAHLWLHRFDGVSRTRIKTWRGAFIRGYGRGVLEPHALARWELASLTRLACLASVSPGAEERVPALLRESRRLVREGLA